MSSRKNEIFDAFVQANGLNPKRVFGGHDTYEGGLFKKPLTRGEIESTVGFTGFVDGIEGRANRAQGPNGSPDPGQGPSIDIGERVKGELRKYDASGSPFDAQLSAFFNQEIEIAGVSLYNEQYELGRLARK